MVFAPDPRKLASPQQPPPVQEWRSAVSGGGRVSLESIALYRSEFYSKLLSHRTVFLVESPLDAEALTFPEMKIKTIVNL